MINIYKVTDLKVFNHVESVIIKGVYYAMNSKKPINLLIIYIFRQATYCK
jgi:hypothetical protein